MTEKVIVEGRVTYEPEFNINTKNVELQLKITSNYQDWFLTVGTHGSLSDNVLRFVHKGDNVRVFGTLKSGNGAIWLDAKDLAFAPLEV